ncbi:hypothetical protein TNCV_411001 [Trichonephila clavipes]|nr:hypothetical protein TNCV_411001 [Trichonephila clavipes]
MVSTRIVNRGSFWRAMGLSLAHKRLDVQRGPMQAKCVEAQMSSHWCGVEVRGGNVRAQKSSSSLDHDSKRRGLSPKALV